MNAKLGRDRWREAFVDLEQECPWAGPRPQSRELDLGHPERFVARGDDVATFLDGLENNSLLILHGESGAGKSSFLNVGLLEALRRRGYLALPFGGTGLGQREQSWRGLSGSAPEAFLREEFQKRGWLHPAALAKLREGHSLVEVLDRFYGSKALFVFDQFEELLRGDPDAYSGLVRWILDANRTSRIRIVLSLRSEYVYRLGDMIGEARPFTTAYMALQPLDKIDQIREVIQAPNAEECVIDEGVIDQLLTEWSRLHAANRTPKLLAVQACLYSLHGMALERHRTEGGPRYVTKAEVVRLMETALTSARGRADVFRASFDEAIERRLRHCDEAIAQSSLGLPATLRQLARQGVIGAVPHLSSAGYKLERDATDLMALSRERELALARWNRQDVRRLINVLIARRGDFDYLTALRQDIAELCDIQFADQTGGLNDSEVEDYAREGVSPVPWRVDPDDVTAGPLMGFPPDRALVEEARAYVFALDWLETSSLVRITAADGSFRVALIHDGFGPALDAWVAGLGSQPWAAVSSLVAQEGRRFDWDAVGGGSPFENDVSMPRHLANLRWRYCRVHRASFSHVVFLNCDFRGTAFDRCSFEGVTFVNCLLDGASLEGCTIVGPSDIQFDFEKFEFEERDRESQESPQLLTDMPDFVLHGKGSAARGEASVGAAAATAALVAELSWYRGEVAGADAVYSPTSGVPAVPWRTTERHGVPWYPQRAGLAMYGGRLSSLMVKNCTFLATPAGPGSLALCHMAGSSLDFVEQGSGNVHLYFSTVRGIAFTNHVEPGLRDPAADLQVRAYECVLANTFFGEDLAGRVEVRESKVLGISSASDERLQVLVEASTVADGDNVEFSGVTRLPGFATGTASPAAREVLAQQTGRMSYRSTPAKLELMQRVSNWL